MATVTTSCRPAASQGLRHARSGGDAQVLRGCDRPAAGGDLVRDRTSCSAAERVYCHMFFGMGDGGALAFFKFAKPEDQELFGPKMPASPFHHIALNVDAGDAGGDREAPCGGRLSSRRTLRAGAWLLPLGVRHRSQRTDSGVHARSVPRRTRSTAIRRADAHAGTEALDGGRSHFQQYLPLSEDRLDATEHMRDFG